MTTIPTSSSASQRVDAVLPGLIRESMQSIVAALIGTEPEELTTKPPHVPCDEIWGTISFTGDMTWSITLGFPRETATQITYAYTCFEIDYDSPDMGDAIGEFVNILAGDIIARLESHEITAVMSLPTIVRGHNIEMVPPHDVTLTHTPYSVPQGMFWTEVATNSVSSHRLSYKGNS